MKYFKHLCILLIVLVIFGIETLASKSKMKSRMRSKLRMRMKMHSRNRNRMFLLTKEGVEEASHSHSHAHTHSHSHNHKHRIKKNDRSLFSEIQQPNNHILSSRKKALNISHDHHHSDSLNHFNYKESPDVLLTTPRKLELFKESWLTIANKNFENESIYPVLNLPNDIPGFISTGRNSIRVNKLYGANDNTDSSPPTEHSFWFRLSSINFYYTLEPKSLNVLGSIQTHSIADVLSVDKECFRVIEKSQHHADFCAGNYSLKNEWICLFKTLMNRKDIIECNKAKMEAEENVTYIERKVTQPIILIPQPAPFCNADFNYANNGRDWECDCKEGNEQSPIDLPSRENAIKSPVRPVFNYHEAAHKEVISAFDGQKKTIKHMKIENKEHVIQINHDSFGEVVTLDGAIYKASKIVFHTPSEHTIAGKRFPMEMQIIHYGQTKGDIAKQVVLSFLFKKSPGIYNKFLDDLDFFSLPGLVGTREREIHHDIYIPKIFYDTDDDDLPFMKEFSFYTYQGSLTFPPCTQNTIVYVAADPIPIGTTALKLFEEALRVPDMRSSKGDVIISETVNYNNRSLQPRNGRNVFFYEKECELDLGKYKVKQAKRVNGHYEKLVKNINHYYYVNNNKPSGMPGAIVVTKDEAIHGNILKDI